MCEKANEMQICYPNAIDVLLSFELNYIFSFFFNPICTAYAFAIITYLYEFNFTGLIF